MQALYMRVFSRLNFSVMSIDCSDISLKILLLQSVLVCFVLPLYENVHMPCMSFILWCGRVLQSDVSCFN